MPPEDYRRALGDLSGEFSGIGAEMGVRNLQDPDDLEACTTFSDICALVVVAPLDDSPAERAGLRAGDVVLAVDGEPVNGIDLSEAVQRIRGEAGTDVTLTLRRGEETLELTITRAEIELREVTSRMVEPGIGYIALNGFSEPAASQFRDALSALIDDGATSIVFDLRDNPGGYIDAARRIASEFIEEGVLFTQESSGDEVRTWEATGDGVATDSDIEVVVLVNGGSASASEIVAAALKERERATVVGQPTYGKNTVQVWNDLDNGGGVRITISRWFTPDHNSVAPDGVQPEVVVEVPEGTPPERDLFLETALEVLQDRAVGDDEPGESQPASGLRLPPLAWTDAFEPIGWDPGGLLRARA
ncbi:MAG TPA: S41 family peptidase [Candidatus Limnocylindria bacterium]|nr:S41 family peptidase [Candidatus Limnocylindria bacterium]